MADMSFEEHCPCGDTMKVSGYQHHIRQEISAWQRVHNKHANAIAKALAGPPIEPPGPTPVPQKVFDMINVHAAEPVFGMQVGKVVLRTHDASQCAGALAENGKPICCIHNPSNHHMVTWEQNWRGDTGIMERLCPHGIGHPDPDDLTVRTTKWAGVHGCDGCCVKKNSD